MMEKTKKNVPEFRFPEFSLEWEKKTLDEITIKISDGYHGTPLYDEKGHFYFINGNNLVNDAVVINPNTKKVNHVQYDIHKKPLDGNTILLSINGTIGSLAYYNDERVILGKSVCYINLQESCVKEFVFHQLKTQKKYDYFVSELTGTTIKNLSLAAIKKTEIALPIYTEQQKVASFLSEVDEKLQTLKKKKTLLEQYKKGVMQKIFSQELRFKEESGNEFPDWEEKTLGDVTLINMGQSPDSQSYNTDGIGVLLIQGNADISNKMSCPRNWTSEPTKVCMIGDLILTVRAPVGAVAKSLHNACIGRGVCSIRNKPKSNIEFIYQYLLDYEPKWVRLEQGSTFTAVSGSDIKSIDISLPSLKEQAKIATFLSAIDEKISLCSTQIEKTELYKKGLLQKMFC